ncbi:MAG: hypothetical protein INR62_04350 [Rhodospirillales bacterium]|nr:hypothetical protein [Acetobacter sp.]
MTRPQLASHPDRGDSFVLPADHVDLLVSTADTFGLLIPSARAAFSPLLAHGRLPGDPRAAGEMLVEEYRAAVRWRQDRGRRPIPPGSDPYGYAPVELFSEVEVIKAGHAYLQAAADSPGWSGSAARQLVEAVVRAACERLPGYARAA